MKIITKKQQMKIAKHLAALHIIGKTHKDLDAFTKQIENIAEIAGDLNIACELLDILKDYNDRAKGRKGMIDEKKLIREMWDRYNGHYNNASRFSKEETEMANRVLSDFQKAIDKQPKVGQWIPCSKRLPNNDKYDWVLAQVQEDNGNLWIPRVMEYRESKDDWYLEDENPCWLKEQHGNAFKVIAWMPLPEPFKAGEQE